MHSFLSSLVDVLNEMSPYLLLGFLIAGVLHVFVPHSFYQRYLSRDNKFSVIYAALIGIPLPLCSCGVIPTAIGLRRERASKGAVASFLIATPQTGIDSILATFSLMGLGFAIVRPVAALVTGVCGGLIVNRIVADDDTAVSVGCSCEETSGSRWGQVLRYAFVEMIHDIGPRLAVGLLLAALINVAVPDEFFLTFGAYPLLQMLVILLVAVPMYICSTGSIPIAAALVMKGLSPGAALVMLMAGPAVNMASLLVVRKSLGKAFTWIYLLTVVSGAILFGLIVNALDIGINLREGTMAHAACCDAGHSTPLWRWACSALLLLLIVYAFAMRLFHKKPAHTVSGATIYHVEGMHCSHCKKAVEEAVSAVEGVETVEADIDNHLLNVTGPASPDQIRKAVEQAGFDFKGAMD